MLWEHRRRVGIIALSMLSFSMVLALLFSIPSVIVTWSGVGGFDTQLESTKTLVALQRKQAGGDAVNDLLLRADMLEESLTRRTPLSILEEIVPRIPAEVSVKQFSYSAEGEEIVVTVLGKAATRNALIEFGNNLRQSALFSRVDVPIASLAKSENIEFSLTLSLSEPVPLETSAAVPDAVSEERKEEGTTTPQEL